MGVFTCVSRKACIAGKEVQFSHTWDVQLCSGLAQVSTTLCLNAMFECHGEWLMQLICARNAAHVCQKAVEGATVGDQ